MSVYGCTTMRDLTSWGSFFTAFDTQKIEEMALGGDEDVEKKAAVIGALKLSTEP